MDLRVQLLTYYDILRAMKVFFLLALIAFVSILLYGQYLRVVNTPNPITIQNSYPNADNLSFLVNNWRYENGLQPFTKNETLCNIAASRSAQITTDFSHDGFLPRVDALLVTASFGENLIHGYNSAQAVFTAWLNSPEHRKNLANPVYTQMCIVCQQTYCVQELSSSF